MEEPCNSPFDTIKKYYLLPADWSEDSGHEWQQQREREVQEQRQRAAAEYTASLRARLGNAPDGCLPLLTPGDDGVNQSWLAFVLGCARAFAECSVPPARAH